MRGVFFLGEFPSFLFGCFAVPSDEQILNPLNRGLSYDIRSALFVQIIAEFFKYAQVLSMSV